MKVGLVLSGGGARAAMHLGTIRALEEYGIEINLIAGTSAGAVVGALYAQGYTPEEGLEIVSEFKLFRTFQIARGGNGLLRLSKAEQLLHPFFPENSFSSLRIPTLITATDILRAETVSFDRGPLLPPMLASCCLPGLFEPYSFQERQLVDGGVLNNMPVEYVEPHCDFIIGAHCNPFQVNPTLKSAFEVAYRSLLLAVHNQNLRRLSKCNLLIEPPQLTRYSLFDFKKMKSIYQIGYEYALQVLATADLPYTKKISC